MNNELVLQIVLSVMGIVSIMVTGLLIPYLKTKIDSNKREDIIEWVDKAVKAAEQLFPEAKTGKAKKQFVINFLKACGVKMSDEELDVLVEAAVKDLNLWKEEIKKN